MIGILACGILMLVSIVLRITLGTLTDKFEFLESWLPYFNYIIIGFAVFTALFIAVVLIKSIKKK